VNVKAYHVHVATDVRDQPVLGMQLLAVAPTPKVTTENYVRVLTDVYERDAATIVGALFEHLPGGTVDRVLALLCARKASLLKVTLS
jgi:hypothetical protein